MAAEAWVTEIRGVADVTPEAWVTDIRATTVQSAQAWVTSVRGEAALMAGAPIAVPGPPQDLSAGARAFLTVQGVPSGSASIASYAARLVNKSTNGQPINILGANTANPCFRGPVVQDPSWYDIGFTVTDSNGAISAEAVVRISFDQAYLRFMTSAGSKPMARQYATAKGFL